MTINLTEEEIFDQVNFQLNSAIQTLEESQRKFGNTISENLQKHFILITGSISKRARKTN